MSQETARPSLVFESIELVSAPGMSHGFRLAGFQPGLNVVWGPNASGKSTTARALHSLFWPDRPDDRTLVEASFRFNQSNWFIERNGKHVSATRNGSNHAALTFTQLSAETRDRYLLALHDLIRGDDRSFAAYIAKEMSGGFDLEDAVKKTGLEANINPISQQKQLDVAIARHRELIALQSTIATDAVRLARLKEEAKKVVEARRRAECLGQVKRAWELAESVRDAEALVSRFDPAMNVARPDDASSIDTWAKTEPIERDREVRNVNEQTGLEERRATLGLPVTAAAKRAFAIASAHLGDLRTSEDRMKRAQSDLAGAKIVAKQLRDEIDAVVPAELRVETAVKLLRELSTALERVTAAEQIAGSERILAAQIERPDAQLETRPLYARYEALLAWMQTSPPPMAPPVPRSIRIVALIAALVIVAEAGLLGYYWNEYAYGIAAIGLVIIVLTWRIRGPEPEADKRIHLAEAYERQGHPPLADWSTESVAAAISQTLEDLRTAEHSNDLHRIWTALTPALERRDEYLTAANDSLDMLRGDTNETITFDRAALNLIASSLDATLTAERRALQLETTCTENEEMFAADLRLFNESVATLTNEVASDAASASATLNEINDRVLELERIENRQSELEHELTISIRPALARIETNRVEMIERYQGRSVDEIATLAAQYPEWSRANETYRHRREQFEIELPKLGTDFDLGEWPPDRIERERAECDEVQVRAADNNQEIGRIQNEINSAMRSHQVADALVRVEKARDELISKRDDYLRSAIGKLVVEEIRNVARDRDLPEVAERARVLFRAFTNRRYELRMGSGKTPEFTAWDTHISREQPLDQLSGGTRVQLLIAVRMAFIERLEAEACLPVIFDETLANADDIRADALIDATLQIAADGRQVFYFTAQLDEVDKWRSRAAERHMPIAVIDITQARMEADRTRRPSLELPPMSRHVFPPPDGRTRSEYRYDLGVPPIDHWNGGADTAHLWYLIDDLSLLYRLVVEQRVTVWGEVRNFAGNGAAPALDLDPTTYARLSACADALQELLMLVRVGRGRPVTEDDLIGSRGMGSKFDDECRTLLKSVDYDGEKFLKRMDEGAIRGFRAARIESFRAWFEENGNIVEEVPYAPEIIRGRIARNCREAIERGDLDLPTIDRLLDEVFPSEYMPGEAPSAADETTMRLPIGE